MPQIKIVLADSQYIVRAGVKAMLAGEAKFSVVAECSNSSELGEAVSRHQPDVVIMDYNLAPVFDVKDIASVKVASPKTRILIVSDDKQKEQIYAVLEYGIKNFLTKECDQAEIISAVYATAKGEKFFCHKVVDIILEKHISDADAADCAPTILSARENEIVKLVAQGFTAKEIAEQLFLSHHTVSTHRKNIFRKIGVSSVSELVLYAIKMGLL